MRKLLLSVLLLGLVVGVIAFTPAKAEAWWGRRYAAGYYSGYSAPSYYYSGYYAPSYVSSAYYNPYASYYYTPGYNTYRYAAYPTTSYYYTPGYASYSYPTTSFYYTPGYAHSYYYSPGVYVYP